MQSQNGEVRSQTKKRLQDLLKAALGGVVVAAATLVTPASEASAIPPPQKPALEERVEEVRKQVADANEQDLYPVQIIVGPHFHNWGNHWNNWNNWHNWHNWHNW